MANDGYLPPGVTQTDIDRLTWDDTDDPPVCDECGNPDCGPCRCEAGPICYCNCEEPDISENERLIESRVIDWKTLRATSRGQLTGSLPKSAAVARASGIWWTVNLTLAHCNHSSKIMRGKCCSTGFWASTFPDVRSDPWDVGGGRSIPT